MFAHLTHIRSTATGIQTMASCSDIRYVLQQGGAARC